MSTPRSDLEDKEIAIHESGHALMFDALGIPISSVTINAGCGGEKLTHEGCVKISSATNSVWKVLSATLAGPAASFFIANESMDEEAMLKFRSDQKVIRDIFSEQKNAGTYDEFWQRLQAFQGTWLRKWLSEYRDSILRFADVLIRERTLSGDDLASALTSAWAGSKPDVVALGSELISTLNLFLDDDVTAGPHVSDLSACESGIRGYRLVDRACDPIEVGSLLSRTSDRSHQKLGEGMYFALTRGDALTFSAQNHGHHYTHLLTCCLKGIEKDDLVDLVADPNFFLRLKPTVNSPLRRLTGRALQMKYCEIEGKKGLLWRAQKKWTELCLLSAHLSGTVVIEAAEELPKTV